MSNEAEQLDDPGGGAGSNMRPKTMASQHGYFRKNVPALSWNTNSSQPANYNGQCLEPLRCGEQSSGKYQHESADVDRSSVVAIDVLGAPAGQHEHKECHQYSSLNRLRTVSSFSGLQGGQPQHGIERERAAHAPQNKKTSDWDFVFDDTYMSSRKDGTDLEEALSNLGDGFKPHHGSLNSINPASWRYVLTSGKHYQNLVEASYAPFKWAAALLEKAILRHSFSGRYVGLYPHSADPPIQNTVTIPAEYQRHITTKTSLFYQRPRSQEHQQDILHSLFGAHITPTFAQRLLSCLLQVARTITSTIFTYLDFLRPSRFGCKSRSLSSTGSDCFKRLKTTTQKHPEPHLLNMDPTEPDLLNMDQILATVHPDFLSIFMEEDPKSPFAGLSNPAVSGEEEFPYLVHQLPSPEYIPVPSPEYIPVPSSAYIPVSSPEYIPDIGLTYANFAPESDYHIAEAVLPFHLYNNCYSLYPSMQPFQAGMYPAEEEYGSTNTNEPLPPPANFNVWDLVNLPSPTPAPAEVEADVRLQSEDILPGLTTPTASQSVSPQTEGLETPTFTPRSSVSVASPPQAPSRRTFICEEQSCGHKQFARRCDLNKHLKTHLKHLKCEYWLSLGCDYRASTEKDRKRHQRTVHEGEKSFFCHLCEQKGGRPFSRADNLKDHQKRVHGVGK